MTSIFFPPCPLGKDYLEYPAKLYRQFEDMNGQNEFGQTWLHRASYHREYSLIKYNLQNIKTKSEAELKECVAKKDFNGLNCLYFACAGPVSVFKGYREATEESETRANERLETIKVLLEFGSPFQNIRTSENGWTMAHWLAFNGDHQSLSFLTDHGLACFLPDHRGRFPIDIAGARGSKETVRWFLQSYNLQLLKLPTLTPNYEVEGKTQKLKEAFYNHLTLDGYQFYFLKGEYLRLIMIYWTCFYSLGIEGILPIEVAETPDQFQQGSPMGNRQQAYVIKKDVSDLPCLTVQLPTLNNQSVFHAAARADESYLRVLFSFLPMVYNKKYSVLLDIPDCHNFKKDWIQVAETQKKQLFHKRENRRIEGSKEFRDELGEWDCQDSRGETPLHIASREGNPSGIKLLLEKGADFSRENKYYWTPPNLVSLEASIQTYREFFANLRLAAIEKKDFYLKREWLFTKGLVKSKNWCKRNPKVYVDDFKKKVEPSMNELSINMIFNAETSTFYHLAFRIQHSLKDTSDKRSVMFSRANNLIDVLANRGYRVSLVTDSPNHQFESYQLLLYAPNSKITEVSLG